MSERWLPIEGFSLYEASSLGRIRRIGVTRGKVGAVLKPWLSEKEGYEQVNLCQDGRNIKRLVHLLVCAAFHGPADGRIGDHADRDHTNNKEDNLRWTDNLGNAVNIAPRGAFKGISRKRSKWAAYGCLHGKTVYLGVFSTEIEAAKAYDRFARLHYGLLAYLNFNTEEGTSHGSNTAEMDAARDREDAAGVQERRETV